MDKLSLHSSIADHLIDNVGATASVVAIALHLKQAGRVAEARPYFLEAGASASRSSSHSEAIEYLSQALEIARPSDDGVAEDIEEGHSMLLYGAALFSIGKYEKSTEVLMEGLTLAGRRLPEGALSLARLAAGEFMRSKSSSKLKIRQKVAQLRPVGKSKKKAFGEREAKVQLQCILSFGYVSEASASDELDADLLAQRRIWKFFRYPPIPPLTLRRAFFARQVHRSGEHHLGSQADHVDDRAPHDA